jgi:hypothetical protein
MEKLNRQLDGLINRFPDSKEFRRKLEGLKSVYPFSRHEYVIAHLLAAQKLSMDDYYELRDEYGDRNRHLNLFEMAPRTFGDTWGLSHVCGMEPELKRPSKAVDGSYRGEYDLYLDWLDPKRRRHYIRIEVKASRANDREQKEGSLNTKAIASGSKRPFLMNFQQQKPKCCDVFIWIAVYSDTIRYWVINSREVQTNRYFTPQHRNRATAGRGKNYLKEDIYEGQIMITEDTISSFDRFLSPGKSLKNSIITQFIIQKKRR